MSDNTHDRVMKVFLDACDLRQEDRKAYLEGACGDDAELRASVESLLAYDGEKVERLRSGAIQQLARTMTADEENPDQIERIGPYRLRKRIGEGGMGVVFLAEQERPVRRTVALKLVKPGLDTEHVVKRFESERQALALMQHPNVARVLDAGSTDTGRPYFVMEYVQGTPITTYCDEQVLDNRQRVELFTQVCEGIQHAHQKGIIHRDIKPSNVLVEQQNGTVRPVVIDFGVAKAVGPRLTEQTLHTQYGALIGTPEYMSPEQADPSNADIDTRTDVYSLGALLYELLVGERPFDSSSVREAGLIELLRMIQQEEPSKPSTRISTLGAKADQAAQRRKADVRSLARELRGDLDWIAMKAIAKDRSHRYGSPADLAADLRRHANHEPVEAGPPSVSYRVRKFVRRHALGVGLVALGFVLVLGVAARERIQARAIAAERNRANQEAKAAEQVAGFMTGLFEVADPSEALGNAITVREILDEGAERIEQEIPDDPLIQARMMRTMGTVYRNLGLYEPAKELLARALAIHEEVLGFEDLEVANDLDELRPVLFEQYDFEGARDLAERALEIRQTVLPPDHPDMARALTGVAGLRLQFNRIDEAEALLREALAIQERVLEPDDPDLARTHRLLGVMHKNRGDTEQAISAYRRAVGILESHGEVDDPDLAELRHRLAQIYYRAWRFDEAQEQQRQALETYRRVFEDKGMFLIDGFRWLGQIEVALGNIDAAVPLFKTAQDVAVRTFGEKKHFVSHYINWALIDAYLRLGDLDSAELQLEYSSRLIDITTFEDQEWIWTSDRLLANLMVKRGDVDGARALLEPRLAAMKELGGAYDLDYLYNAAVAHSLLGDETEALRVLSLLARRGFRRESLAFDPEFDWLRGASEFDALAHQMRASVGTGRYYWGWGLYRAHVGDLPKARQLLDEHLKQVEDSHGTGSPEVFYERALVHAVLGERDDALGALERAIELGFDDPRVNEDPEFDSLRGDPEFQRVVRGVTD